MKYINIFLLTLLPSLAFSEFKFQQTVVKVVDGDTIHLQNKSGHYKLRLTEIDAPEINQPYGLDSKEYLIKLLKDEKVDVNILGEDRYGRYLGRLYLNGQDINKLMIIDGMAWCYLQYSKDPTFLVEQNRAKNNKTGLWKQKNPLEPWIWRKK